ncbi:MAG: hypothetical protein QXF44_03035 [Candidatus Bathyarchaeia archaeon]
MTGQSSKPFLNGACLQFWYEVKASVYVEFFIVICEEAVGLVTTVVLGSHAPVDVWKYGLLFEVYCAEYSTARFESSSYEANKDGAYLSVFMTFLTKNYVNF